MADVSQAEHGASALPILMYHSIDHSGSVVSVSPEEFAAHMDCLAAAGVRGISLNEAATHHEGGQGWPSRSVVLTFDDGYASLYEAALPILLQHGFCATVFLVSGHIGGANDWAPPPMGLGLQPLLTWEQVAEMSLRGIEIGAHTQTHPDLRRLSATEIEREMMASRADIEGRLNRSVSSFAYPFGALDRSAVQVASRHFRTACTSVLRRATDEPFHELPRVDMYYVRTPRALGRLMRGELDRYLMLRRWGRAARSLLRG
jgi:peptidoglycan/xylan/chitin deacetylase (PgdA/CDA1 family)